MFSIVFIAVADYTKDKLVHTSDGSKIGYMVPSILQEPIPREPRDKSLKSGTIAWMCLPYFTLQKYLGTLSSLPYSSHPMRTLLQTRFALTRKERDMQQAVCHLLGSPPEHCFHIAQMWCIIVDDGKNTSEIERADIEYFVNAISSTHHLFEDFYFFAHGEIPHNIN